MIGMEEVVFGEMFNYLKTCCIFYYLSNLYKMRNLSKIFFLVLSFLLMEWVDQLWLPVCSKLALPDGQVNQVQQAVLQQGTGYL